MGRKNFVLPARWQAGLARRSERFAQAGRRVQKKSPAFALKTGDFTRLHPSQSYPRRPPCEEYPGRFSDSPDLDSPSHPELVKGQWLFCQGTYPEFSSGSGLQRRVRPRLSPFKRR
jgi:hypothetical protein